MASSFACWAAARALISAMEPFFGALEDESALAVAVGIGRFASDDEEDEEGFRALDESDVELRDGLPFDVGMSFFDAEEADRSAKGRGVVVVEVVVGRAEPAYPDEGRSAGREILAASTPDGLVKVAVVLGAFGTGELLPTSSSAFLLTGIAFCGREGGVGAAGFSPVMEASN